MSASISEKPAEPSPSSKTTCAAGQATEVIVVADAGLVSEANQKAIEAAALSFVIGAKIPDNP